MRKILRDALTAVGGMAVALGGATAPAWSGGSDVKDTPELEEIVVTASKREERLLDAPLSITALSAKTLDNLGVTNFEDYAGLVPNVSTGSGAAPGDGAIILRGLNSGYGQLTSTTGYYIGDTALMGSGPFSFSGFFTPDPDLIDVDHIEVLKGPQGTLYGASALGGLVRIIPAKVDLTKVSGEVRVEGADTSGGGEGYGYRASINLPIITDRLGVRLSGFKREEPGYITDTATRGDRYAETQSKGGSVTASFKATDQLEFNLRGLYQSAFTNGFSNEYHYLASNQTIVGERTYNAAIPGFFDTHYKIAEATMNWTTSAGTLTAVADTGDVNLRTVSDVTGSYGAAFEPLFEAPPALGGFGLNFSKFLASELVNPDNRKTSAELRFVGNRIGAFEYLVGAFYTREETQYNVNVTIDSIPAVPAPFSNIATVDTSATYKETAGFANLTWYLTDNIDFTGGGRFSHNVQNSTTSSLPGVIALGNYSLPEFSDSSTTYQFTARWRPVADISTYARVATGYRPGGPQTVFPPPAGIPLTYKPDTVQNFEVGVKGRTPDRQFDFDAAAYHINWKDIQLNEQVGGVLFEGNAGRAAVNGVELQSTWSPVEAFALGAAFGYNDAKLTDIGTSTAAYLGAKVGDQLPGSPKLSAALYGDYRFPLVDQWKGSVGATGRYQGDKQAAYSSATALQPQYTIPAYATLDLRTSATSGPYTMRFAIENVTDKDGVVGVYTDRIVADPTATMWANVIRPRTYRLSLSYDF